MQYFIESVLPVLLLMVVLVTILVVTIWLGAWKAAQLFLSIRAQRRITESQRQASLLYRNAVAATLAELADPNKTILRETISPDVQGLLMDAHAQQAVLPALTREDRA